MDIGTEFELRQHISGDNLLINLLVTQDAILVGHFRLASGCCSRYYFDKDRILGQQPADQNICKRLAEKIPCRHDIATIIGPERNGIAIAYGVALALHEITGQHFGHVAAYKNDNGQFAVPKQTLWRLKPPVLIVDDVVSTKSTMNRVAAILGLQPEEIVARACLVDRRPTEARDKDDIVSLIQSDLPIWSKGQCPICADNVPLSRAVGHAP